MMSRRRRSADDLKMDEGTAAFVKAERDINALLQMQATQTRATADKAALTANRPISRRGRRTLQLLDQIDGELARLGQEMSNIARAIANHWGVTTCPKLLMVLPRMVCAP